MNGGDLVMPKYGINREGIESLRQLREEILQGCNEINESAAKLHNTISGLGDDLGIYYDLILQDYKKVLYIMKKALADDGGARYLVKVKLPKMISDLEVLMADGLGDSDEPQKVLKL